MDEKTADLRDIFMSVSDDGTVTETQAETRGTLAGDEGVDTDRVAAVVDALRDSEPFDTDFETATYVDVVRAFYDDVDDETIAADLDLSPSEVFSARMDLHLLRDDEVDPPFDLAVLRQRAHADVETLADETGTDVETIRHFRRVVAAQDAARTANHRYQREFDELLTDADLAGRLTEGLEDDGLREAAEDIETDVSF